MKMNSIDYINSLIKERDDLKKECKKHVETIYLLKQELLRLNRIISKNNKSVEKLEDESVNTKMQKELDKNKRELKKLKEAQKNLEIKYNDVVCENIELKRIFDEVETTSDSD